MRIVPSKDKVIPIYLIYIILHTTLEKPPRIILRKNYESQLQALDAFRREYGMWLTSDGKTGLFPRRHTEQQLSSSYLTNSMEMSKTRDAAPQENKSESKYRGRGIVEYAIVHRDDVELKDGNHSKRRCVVVYEETTSEKM